MCATLPHTGPTLNLGAAHSNNANWLYMQILNILLVLMMRINVVQSKIFLGVFFARLRRTNYSQDPA